eukprot:15357408-Ditylum_brightwellii.AAC.1
MALNGPHDFNAHPMAQLRTKIVVHKTVEKSPWGLNGAIGWYTWPTLEHYRCYKVYIPSTEGTESHQQLSFI